MGSAINSPGGTLSSTSASTGRVYSSPKQRKTASSIRRKTGLEPSPIQVKTQTKPEIIREQIQQQRTEKIKTLPKASQLHYKIQPSVLKPKVQRSSIRKPTFQRPAPTDRTLVSGRDEVVSTGLAGSNIELTFRESSKIPFSRTPGMTAMGGMFLPLRQTRFLEKIEARSKDFKDVKGMKTYEQKTSKAQQFKSVEQKLSRKSAESKLLKKIGYGSAAGVTGLVEPFVRSIQQSIYKRITKPSKSEIYKEISDKKDIFKTPKAEKEFKAALKVHSIFTNVEKIKKGRKDFISNLLPEKPTKYLEVLGEGFKQKYGESLSTTSTKIKRASEIKHIEKFGYTQKRGYQFLEEAQITTAMAIVLPGATSAAGTIGSKILTKIPAGKTALKIFSKLPKPLQTLAKYEAVVTAIESPTIIAETGEYGLGTALIKSQTKGAVYAGIGAAGKQIGKPRVKDVIVRTTEVGKMKTLSVEAPKPVSQPTPRTTFEWDVRKGEIKVSNQIKTPPKTYTKTLMFSESKYDVDVITKTLFGKPKTTTYKGVSEGISKDLGMQPRARSTHDLLSPEITGKETIKIVSPEKETIFGTVDYTLTRTPAGQYIKSGGVFNIKMGVGKKAITKTGMIEGLSKKDPLLSVKGGGVIYEGYVGGGRTKVTGVRKGKGKVKKVSEQDYFLGKSEKVREFKEGKVKTAMFDFNVKKISGKGGVKEFKEFFSPVKQRQSGFDILKKRRGVVSAEKTKVSKTQLEKAIPKKDYPFDYLRPVKKVKSVKSFERPQETILKQKPVSKTKTASPYTESAMLKEVGVKSVTKEFALSKLRSPKMKPYVIPRMKTSPKMITKIKPLKVMGKTKIFKSVKPKTMQQLDVVSKQATLPTQVTALKQRATPKLGTYQIKKSVIIPRQTIIPFTPMRPITTPRTPGGLFPPMWAGAGGGALFGKGSRLGRLTRVLSYKPSLVAIEKGIKKKKKTSQLFGLTGLEIRPIKF